MLQSEGIASTVTSQKNSVQLDGLRPDARYVVQVRARTVAGYGQYSHPAEFETTSERGTCAPTPSLPRPIPLSSRSPVSSLSPGSGAQQLQEQLPLIVGSATAGLVFVVAVVVIAVVCLRYSQAHWSFPLGPSCHISDPSPMSHPEPPSWAQSLLAGKALQAVPTTTKSTGRVDQVH